MANNPPQIKIPDLILLLGDSITQQGYDQYSPSLRNYAWVSALSAAYQRRLTIINAGLSGYNTLQILHTLPHLIPSAPKIRLITIFLGANDARLPDTEPKNAPQHIPLGDYKRNLKTIVQHPLIRTHVGGGGGTRILIITPPPIDEGMCEADDASKGIHQVRRLASTTLNYAQAAREASQELNVECLDLWTVFMKEAGWREGESLIGQKGVEKKGLERLLRDGLHFTADGEKVLFEALMEKIQEKWPEMAPLALPFVLPGWNEVEAWKDLKQDA